MDLEPREPVDRGAGLRWAARDSVDGEEAIRFPYRESNHQPGRNAPVGRAQAAFYVADNTTATIATTSASSQRASKHAPITSAAFSNPLRSASVASP